MGRQEARELANFLRRESRVEIDPIAVAELGRVIKAVRLPAGKPLYRKGERPAGMWLVSRGMVELYVNRTSWGYCIPATSSPTST